MVLRAVAVGLACLLVPTVGCVRADRVAAPTVIIVAPVAGAPLGSGTQEVVSGGAGRWASHAEVEVEWHGDWFPATVLEKRADRWRVHYDGYGSEWDEVVDESRIRERRVKPELDDTNEIEDDADP